MFETVFLFAFSGGKSYYHYIIPKYFTKKPLRTIKHTVTFESKPKTVEILSFLPKKAHAADSFGIQWARYRDVQIDRKNGRTFSQDHLEQMLGSSVKKLKGKTILEIGSGAGRYTDVLRDYADKIITVDPSSAILSNVALGAKNVIAAQGDLFNLPINANTIDIVWCRGVVQHTKDTKKAIQTLLRYVKPGGLVIIDVYAKTWRNLFMPKYYLRPWTKKLDEKKVYLWLEKYIPRILWIKAKIINRLFPNVRYFREIPNILIPIADYTQYLPGLTWEEYVQWAILDTFDMYTPEYDEPLTYKEITSLFSPKEARFDYASEELFQFRIKRLKK